MPTPPDFSEYQQRMAKLDALQKTALPSNKAALFDALQAAGITRVSVVFNGEGDSGQIESVDAFNAENTIIPLPAVTITLQHVVWEGLSIETKELPVTEVIEQMTYQFLGMTNGGWQNNDGAYGDVSFDVAERTITLDINERFVDSTNSVHVF